MKKRMIFLYFILVILLLVLVGCNIFIGSAGLDFDEMWDILLHGDRSSVNGVIVWKIRIPRVIAATLLGGALALSGYLLQSFFANPIAGPYVLGISSGAKLVVAVLMVTSCKYGFGFGSLQMVLAAFIGSAMASLLVILAAKRVRNMSVLIVCGVMIGYVCSAITELLVAFAEDSNIVNLHNWSMGSFSGMAWSSIPVILSITLVGLVAALLLSKGIEAYLYGEQYAQSIGINISLFRVLLIAVSSLLSAMVTAFAGPISFVGIAVPHVIRTTFKTAKPMVIITASFLGGAVFCLLCDLIARSLFAPVELSISTITAVFGAPVVIIMLLKKKRG